MLWRVPWEVLLFGVQWLWLFCGGAASYTFPAILRVVSGIKGCSDIFVPVLKHIFNLSLSRQYFPTLWGQAAIVPVFKKGNSASLCNYRPISILNNCSEVFEFVIHDHVSHYLKAKLNPRQHGFTKSEYTTTNLVTYFDIPLVCSQRQADATLRFSGGYVN
jgi:hypothetical protein